MLFQGKVDANFASTCLFVEDAPIFTNTVMTVELQNLKLGDKMVGSNN